MGEVMEITKTDLGHNNTKVKLVEGTNEISFYDSDNGDVYMDMYDGIRISEHKDNKLYIDVTEEDKEVFDIISKLYKGLLENEKLHGENNSIVWVSDDGLIDEEDKFILKKQDGFFRLEFQRVPCDTIRKHSSRIHIRFCTSGSRYKPSHTNVMLAFRELIEIAKKPKEKKIR